MKLNWTELQRYLVQDDSFDENGGEFQSYLVKPNTVLQLNVDDSGEWATVNYVQWLPASEDGEACIVLQLDCSPENPANYLIGDEIRQEYKVFVEMDAEMVDSLVVVVENEIDYLNKGAEPEFFDEEELATHHETKAHLEAVDTLLGSVFYFTAPYEPAQ